MSKPAGIAETRRLVCDLRAWAICNDLRLKRHSTEVNEATGIRLRRRHP